MVLPVVSTDTQLSTLQSTVGFVYKKRAHVV